MKAVVFDHTGPPAEVLFARDVPAPAPGPGEVLVRMLASPVNPSDLMYVEGRYKLQPTLPATPGFEGVGVVERSGGGLLGRFRVGKRVAVLGGRTGAWAEYAVAPAKRVFPVPAGLPDEQAAGLFVNPATAVVLTRHVLAVPAGEWLLQTAAGGTLGKMVIRLGKKYGFKTANVVRRREQVAELTALGADAVLVEADGPITDQVRQLTGGGVRYAMDPVGGDAFAGVVSALADGGRAVLYGSLSGGPAGGATLPPAAGGRRVEKFWLAEWMESASLFGKLRLMRQVRALVAEGALRTEVGATFPLDRVAEAVREAVARGKPGKVLLRIGVL
jgi:NADPH2:quinone reductase